MSSLGHDYVLLSTRNTKGVRSCTRTTLGDMGIWIVDSAGAVDHVYGMLSLDRKAEVQAMLKGAIRETMVGTCGGRADLGEASCCGQKPFILAVRNHSKEDVFFPVSTSNGFVQLTQQRRIERLDRRILDGNAMSGAAAVSIQEQLRKELGSEMSCKIMKSPRGDLRVALHISVVEFLPPISIDDFEQVFREHADRT